MNNPKSLTLIERIEMTEGMLQAAWNQGVALTVEQVNDLALAYLEANLDDALEAAGYLDKERRDE